MPGESSKPNVAPSHWLVAAWPGMANVAVLAAGYIVQKLGLKAIGQMPPRGHFDIQAVEVRSGIITAPRLPRSVFYSGHPKLSVRSSGGEPGSTPRLTVFVGESQPASGSYAFANELVEKAEQMGVDRIVTFASLASQLHPSEKPRIFGAATRGVLMESLVELDVQPLEEGQIGGLNGVLLGAVAERGKVGTCLLGEIPFFAVQIPNPKAAAGVLGVFKTMSGIELDLTELEEHGQKIDQLLVGMLERMQGGEDGGEFGTDEDEDEPTVKGAAPDKKAEPAEPALDLKAREKIERLFEAARQDKAKGVALKRELDKLGVFKQYENRFLDLFKRAE